MTCWKVLEIGAQLAAIATVIGGVIVWSARFFTVHRHMKALEKELAKKNQPNDDSLTIGQLATALNLTEDQLLKAAARSKKIEPWAGQSGKERRFRTIKKLN